MTFRVSVLPSAVASVATELDRRLVGKSARITATVSAGVVRVRLNADNDPNALHLVALSRDVAARHDGVCVVESASRAVKREIDVLGVPRSDIAVMRRLKHELDPDGILAPSRFIARL
jgi:FAD/FMN-containing dehydrogenase